MSNPATICPVCRIRSCICGECSYRGNDCKIYENIVHPRENCRLKSFLNTHYELRDYLKDHDLEGCKLVDKLKKEIVEAWRESMEKKTGKGRKRKEKRPGKIIGTIFEWWVRERLLRSVFEKHGLRVCKDVMKLSFNEHSSKKSSSKKSPSSIWHEFDAIISSSKRPIAVLEIKYHVESSVHEQLKPFIDSLKDRKVKVALLTFYEPDESSKEKLDKFKKDYGNMFDYFVISDIVKRERRLLAVAERLLEFVQRKG